MLTAYIRAAMRYAQYKILEDNTFYGEIAPLAGVYANADTLFFPRRITRSAGRLDSSRFATQSFFATG